MNRFLTRQFFWGLPAATFATSGLVFLFFLATMNRGLFWFDSAELALAAQTLGVSHPPGQPLYILVLHFLSKISPTNSLLLMNMFSALSTAALVLIVAKLVYLLLPASKLKWSTALIMNALLAMSMLHPQVWAQATKIELYPFAALLSLIHLFLIFRIRQHTEARFKHWLCPGVTLGLLFCVHPVLAVVNGLCSLILVGKRGFAVQFIGFVAGLTPYIYIFTSSIEPSRLVWGRFDSVAGALFYLRGFDYRANLGVSTMQLLINLFEWFIHFYKTPAGLMLLALSAMALQSLFKRSRRSAFALFLFLLLPHLYIAQGTAFSTDNPDLFGAILAPLMLILALTVTVSVEAIHHAGTIDWKKNCDKLRLSTLVFLGIGSISLLASSITTAVTALDNDQTDMASEFSNLVESSLPLDPSILVLQSDHLFFPALYRQIVDGRFKQTVLFNPGWANSSWYWLFLKKRYPNLNFPRGSFGRTERIEKFLSLNKDRHLLFEQFEPAASGLEPVCLKGVLFHQSESCGKNTYEPATVLNFITKMSLSSNQHTRSIAAFTAVNHSLALWYSGYKKDALTVLGEVVGKPVASLNSLSITTIGSSIDKAAYRKFARITPFFIMEHDYLNYVIGRLLLEIDSKESIEYLSIASEAGYREAQYSSCMYIMTNGNKSELGKCLR
jgi:hypothetical protein